MGAKQSKRSVDISGKEAEGAGEVAAAGAGGEGRVEPLADVDTLKAQANGDAQHITPPEDATDKEKQLENGTPENEKDATTEKEAKDKEGDKEAAPVTNGESEPAAEEKKENGDTPAAEETKKPKKEKVKKKWSLRSISFSRKDKPKQDKKQKEEEPKTNGETEKVPEEAAEAVAVEGEKAAEEVKPTSEIKEEKTPGTPVTEPITNGSSTPESPKVESPAIEEPAPQERPEAKAVTEPEQLPVNGLSLDETKSEEPKVESKPEDPEPAPVPEIPVKTEVCVEQIPTIETLPPPLPANPPPSCVASFAATTMAPELTDTTTLAKAEETTTLPVPEAAIAEVAPDTKSSHVATPTNNDTITEDNTDVISETQAEILGNTESKQIDDVETLPPPDLTESEHIVTYNETPVVLDSLTTDELPEPTSEVLNDVKIISENMEHANGDTAPELSSAEESKIEEPLVEPTVCANGDSQQAIEVVDKIEAVIENGSMLEEDLASPVTNGIEDLKLNGDSHDDVKKKNLKNKAKECVTQAIECNGHSEEPSVLDVKNVKESECDVLPPAHCEPPSPPSDSGTFPLPPTDLSPPASPTQESIVSDKLADLVPEIPDLPAETIQETTTDVAVAN